MTISPGTMLVATVALEPNRWSTIDPSGAPTVRLAEWVAQLAAGGFDGLEVWERHLSQADVGTDRGPESGQIIGGHVPTGARVMGEEPGKGPGLPMTILNSYVDFDDADDSERRAVADGVARAGSAAVKFNVGNDPSLEQVYADRIAAWVGLLPDGVVALCECHAGTSIAEDPAVAARLLDSAGSPERVQAIVHTHDDEAGLRARFAAYGERITHVHVNHLDPTTFRAPRLRDVRVRLESTVELLVELGFDGSWTIEFVEGVMTDHDRPDHLVSCAIDDLAVLRTIVGQR